MAPADVSLAGELPVPEVGRRDGVGVCASTGMLLSTVLVGMVPRIELGGKEAIKTVLCSNWGVAPWVAVGRGKMEDVWSSIESERENVIIYQPTQYILVSVCNRFNSPSGSKLTTTRGSMLLCDWVSITKVSSGPLAESLYQLTGPVSSRNVRWTQLSSSGGWYIPNTSPASTGRGGSRTYSYTFRSLDFQANGERNT